MGKKIGILVAVMIVSGLSSLWASSTTAAFSRYTSDGRVAGMGMAGTAIAENATAVMWNPAFLTQTQGSDVVLMTAHAFETNYLAAFLGGGGWGVGYLHAGLNGIVETQRKENDFAKLTGNIYDFSGNVVYLSGAMPMSNTLSCGITIKYIDQRIATTNTSDVGCDFGLIYTPVAWLSIGLMAENMLPPTLVWSTGTKEIVPTIYKIGTAYTVVAQILTLATDVVLEPNRGSVINLGLEYTPIPLVAFRMGAHNGNLTVGTGLVLDHARIDMAWEAAPKTDLDDSYRVSIGFVL